MFSIFWPPEFQVNIAGHVIPIKDVNLFIGPKEQQLSLVELDKSHPSEYDKKHNRNFG